MNVTRVDVGDAAFDADKLTLVHMMDGIGFLPTRE